MHNVLLYFRCNQYIPFTHNVVKWPNILYKSSGVNTARFLMYVWPFYNIMHEKDILKILGNRKFKAISKRTYESEWKWGYYRRLLIGILQKQLSTDFYCYFMQDGQVLKLLNTLMPGSSIKVTHT